VVTFVRSNLALNVKGAHPDRVRDWGMWPPCKVRVGDAK